MSILEYVTPLLPLFFAILRVIATGFFVYYVAHLFLMPVAIVLHETGHFIVAKLEKIPVLGYQIGDGETLLKFRFMNVDYQFNRNVIYGAIHVPQLIPTTDRNWRSIVRMALAGPVTNGIFIIGFLACAYLLRDTTLVMAFFIALAYANWICVKSASNDYLMAKVAREKDLETLSSFYVEGVNQHRMA